MFERIKSVFGAGEQKVNNDFTDLEKSSLTTMTGLSDIITMLSPEGLTSADFDFNKNIRDAYLQNSVAFFCTELISNLATQPRWELYVDGEEVTSDSEAKDALAIYRFIKRPNEDQTLQDFIKNYIIHDYLAGESFMYRLPNNNAIKRGNGSVRLIEPNNVMINETEYTINTSSGKSFSVNKRNQDNTRDILHRAHWHPTSKRGTSALTPAWLAIQNYNSAMKWNNSVLNNSARMSLIAVLKSATMGGGKNGALTNEQMKDLSSDLARFSSPKGRGKPFVISGDWDFRELGQSNQDLEFNAGMEAMARNIALAFGVDPVLLSLPGDSTYNNKAAATSTLFKLVVLPKLEAMTDDIAGWFRELIPGTDFEIRLNYDTIPALEEERASLWDRQNASSTILTINERRALLGYEPLAEGGDVIDAGNQAPVDLSFSVDKELLSKQTAFTKLQKDGVIPKDTTFEKEQHLIDAETGMYRYGESD